MKKYSIFVLWAILAVACGGGGEDDSGDINIRKDKISITDRIDLLGDNDTKEVPISATCDWVITEDIDWLTVTPRQGNKNTKSISVSASRNTSGVVRTEWFFISGGDAQTIKVTVTQAKYSDDQVDKTLATNITSLVFEAKEDTKSFSISSNTSWSITHPDWCTVSVSSGTGNADIIVTASENPNEEQRSDQIVISGKDVKSVTINVSQKGNDSTGSQEPGSGDNLPPS